MAEFTLANIATAKNEGGYANNKNDIGGETYRGISRIFHPLWPGWPRVDVAVNEVAAQHGAKSTTVRGDNETFWLLHDTWTYVDIALEGNSAVGDAVDDFFRAEFWDRLGLGRFPDQDLANSVYDAAVNCGVNHPVVWLQRALNSLNEQGMLYLDLAEDGQMGPKTLACARRFQFDFKSRVPCLSAAFLGQRIVYHMDRTRARPDQERFARSWFQRVALQMGAIS